VFGLDVLFFFGGGQLSRHVEDALGMLEERRAMEPRATLGLSGGKDSLVVLDLALKVYGKKNIVPFHMNFIPGLDIVKDLLDYPIKRFGLKEVKQIFSEHFFRAYKYGCYGWDQYNKEEIPIVTRKKIFETVATETKITTMILGVKKIDSMIVARSIDLNRSYGGSVYPIYGWKTTEIFAYLKANQIDIPALYYKGVRGVGVDDASVLFMQNNYPQDLDRIERFFPFVRAIVYKYDHYDIVRKLRLV